MNKLAFVSLAALVLIGGGCFSKEASVDSASELDRSSILVEARENGLIMDETEVTLMLQTPLTTDPDALPPSDVDAYLDANVRDWFSAALADVTGGESYGIAHGQFASAYLNASIV